MYKKGNRFINKNLIELLSDIIHPLLPSTTQIGTPICYYLYKCKCNENCKIYYKIIHQYSLLPLILFNNQTHPNLNYNTNLKPHPIIKQIINSNNNITNKSIQQMLKEIGEKENINDERYNIEINKIKNIKQSLSNKTKSSQIQQTINLLNLHNNNIFTDVPVEEINGLDFCFFILDKKIMEEATKFDNIDYIGIDS
ncbi:hypothetical protein ABK040_012837 [Willaertia magna]